MQYKITYKVDNRFPGASARQNGHGQVKDGNDGFSNRRKVLFADCLLGTVHIVSI